MSGVTVGEWYLYLALLATLGAAFWAHQASQQQGEARVLSIRRGGRVVEALGILLSIVWAITVFPYLPVASVFVAGWIAAVMLRAVSLDTTVLAIRRGRMGEAVQASLLWILLFAALYGSGLFFALNDSSDAAQARLEASAPAAALDAEISTTRERLAGLAAFANAEKAHQAEAQAQAAAQAAREAEAQARAELAALSAPTMPGHLAKWMHPDCSPKHNAQGLPYRTRAEQACPQWEAMQADYRRQRAALEARLSAIGGHGGGASYADKHAEYLGVQAHLVDLQKQRAELSESGRGVRSAWLADDRAIGDLLGIPYEQANRLKWLIYTAFFDVIALLAGILAAWLSDGSGQERRKLNALLSGGFSLQEAASLIASGPPPTHRQAVGFVAETRDADVTRGEAGTGGGMGFVGFAPPGYRADVARDADATRKRDADATRKRDADVTRKRDADVTRGEHVPLQLSGRAAKGRKGMIDTCPTCRQDFIVTTWNKVYCCDDCAAQASGFGDADSRKAAWAKGRK